MSRRRNYREHQWNNCEKAFRGQLLRYLLNRLEFPICNDGVCRMLGIIMMALEKTEQRRIMARIRRHLLSCCPAEDRGILDSDNDDADLIKMLVRDPRKDSLIQQILTTAEPLVQRLESNRDVGRWQKRLDSLQKVFSLADAEIAIVKLVFFYQHIDLFSHTWGHSELVSLTGREPVGAKILEISQFTGLSRATIYKALNEKGPLRQMRLLDKDFELLQPISNYLLGVSDQPLSEQMFRKLERGTVPMASHRTVAVHSDILLSLIRGRQGNERINILLYGPPGTGKTEFAKSLAAELDYELYEVRAVENNDRPDTDIRFRICAFSICLRCIRHDKSLILIDEAENLLSGNAEDGMFSLMSREPRNSAKPMVNELLDNGPGVRLWIVNHRHGIEESTRRRFDYSIEFSKLTVAQREGLWHSALCRHRLAKKFSDTDIQHFSATYDISVGGMDVALRNYRRLTRIQKIGTAATEKRRQAIHTLLIPHLRLMGIDLDEKPRKVANNYSLDGLNVHGAMTPPKCLEMVRKFLARPKINEDVSLRNFNILLYGPPGTGKTEFVKFLANHLQVPLHHVSATEMLSMWVGGTEANIRNAFAQAEQEKAILFLDEADSLLGSRANAQRSWEVSKVNELLCRMEAFRGVLVCATNAKPTLDLAALRRFAAKLEFDYLEPKGKRLFFERLLNDLAGSPLSDYEFRRLDGIPNLAPGDFKVVRQQFLLLDDGDKPSTTELLDALAARRPTMTAW